MASVSKREQRPRTSLRGAASPSSPDPGPTDLFTTLARTGLFLQALQRDCLGELGLTFTEFSVLRLLSRAPARSLAPSILASRIVCTTGAMTKLVDRLERSGLVERRLDPDDRRRVIVAITRKGQGLSAKAAKSYREGRQRVLSLMDEETAVEIHRHLSLLLEALEADKTFK